MKIWRIGFVVAVILISSQAMAQEAQQPSDTQAIDNRINQLSNDDKKAFNDFALCNYPFGKVKTNGFQGSVVLLKSHPDTSVMSLEKDGETYDVVNSQGRTSYIYCTVNNTDTYSDILTKAYVGTPFCSQSVNHITVSFPQSDNGAYLEVNADGASIFSGGCDFNKIALDIKNRRMHLYQELKNNVKVAKENSQKKLNDELNSKEAFKSFRKHAAVDLPAEVLNVSVGCSEKGCDGLFWYKKKNSTCTYDEALLDPIEKKFIPVNNEVDLDKIDPRSIRIGAAAPTGPRALLNPNQPVTVVTGNNGLHFESPYSQDQIDRLQRGWTLIYSKYCSGKKRDF